MNRKNPVGLIRFILERPFVNTAIVFAALVAIGTTTHRSYTSLNASVEGSSLDHSNLLTLGFLGQMHFIFALMASSALPVLIQMGLSLKRRSQLVSAFGLLSISIFFIFNYLNFSADNFSLNTGAVNFLLCFVALSFIILGSLWSAPIGMYVFLGLPLMFGVYYASSGLLLGDGRDGFTTSKFLITNLIVMSLLTVRVNLALGNLQSGVAKYRDEMGIVLGRLFINGLMISLLMGAIWVLIPSSIHSSDADLIVKTHMTLGLKLGLVASLSVLFFIPGFLFLMMERKVSQNLDDSQGEIAFAGSHQEFLLGYERFWRTMRKIFPLPSSYGVMFVLAISAIVIQVKMLPVVYIEDYYLTIMATLIGAIGLLSLRAFIFLGGALFLEQILSNWLLSLSSLSLSPVDNLIAGGFAVFIAYDVAERFRNISIQYKYSVDIIKEHMRTMTGPFLLTTGLVVFMLMAVYVTGYWPNADVLAKAFLMKASVIFVMVMPMVTILASRYGKF